MFNYLLSTITLIQNNTFQHSYAILKFHWSDLNGEPCLSNEIKLKHVVSNNSNKKS